MNIKRFLMAFLATYVVYQAGGFLIHGVWLDPVYEGLAAVFRSRDEMNSMAWVLFVTSAVMVLTFCYVFTRGYENRGVGEGARYGLIMGLFITVVRSFDAHVIYPLPISLSVKWFVSTMALFVVMGIVLALVYESEDV